MAKKVIVNGLNIGYLPPTTSDEILYAGGGNLTVKDKLDEITDDIKTTAWEQLTTEDTRKVYVRRSGHIVQLYYWTDSKFTTETTIATLPQKYRPTTPYYPQTVYVSGGIFTNGNSSVLKLENGGAIKITNANYDGWKQFVSTWIV